MKMRIEPVHNRVGQIYEPFKVRFLERTITELKEDEVLLRVRASAICGSDLHIARGKHPSAPLPCTIGHEFSGEVLKTGEGVTNVRSGDRVTVEPCIVCGTCEACRHGDYGYCEHITYTYRNGDGAMADHIVVKAPYVYRLPEYMTYETGALTEPLSVAVHAVRKAEVRLGDTTLIIGAGAIGMLIAAVCRLSGAQRIIIADLNDRRLETALQMGADIAVNSREKDLEAEIARLTGGRGVDKTFECVGHESCFRQAINTLRHGGTAVIAGIYEDQDLHFAPARLVTHEIRVQGTQGYCWDFPVAIAAAKRIPLEKLITHTFPLSRLQDALDTALDQSSGSIKVLLLPDGAGS